MEESTAATTPAGHRQRGFLLSLLTLLALVGAFLVSPFDVSASTKVGVETRVRAIDSMVAVPVGCTDPDRQQPSDFPVLRCDNRRRLRVFHRSSRRARRRPRWCGVPIRPVSHLPRCRCPSSRGHRIHSLLNPGHDRTGQLYSAIKLPACSSLVKYFRALLDGTKVWAEARNGVEITDGGLNAMPR